ncbi:MAG: YidC/Oxa1 family membrane protein insertase [Nanoarchaeota archaeon]
MINLFHTFFTNPLIDSLVFLYNHVAFQDLGVAIILLTLIIRLALFPLFYKGFRNQTLLQKIQPEIEKIQQLHKHDREKQGLAMMELYRQHKVNPFSSFLIILIQLPILIGLYNVFLHPPAGLNNIFLGLVDLQSTNLLIVATATILQYFQGKLSLPKARAGQENSPSFKMARNMIFLGPLITVAVLYNLPSAIGLYWLATTIFSIGQQLYINKQLEKEDKNGTTATDNSKNS